MLQISFIVTRPALNWSIAVTTLDKQIWSSTSYSIFTESISTPKTCLIYCKKYLPTGLGSRTEVLDGWASMSADNSLSLYRSDRPIFEVRSFWPCYFFCKQWWFFWLMLAGIPLYLIAADWTTRKSAFSRFCTRFRLVTNVLACWILIAGYDTSDLDCIWVLIIVFAIPSIRLAFTFTISSCLSYRTTLNDLNSDFFMKEQSLWTCQPQLPILKNHSAAYIWNLNLAMSLKLLKLLSTMVMFTWFEMWALGIPPRDRP